MYISRPLIQKMALAVLSVALAACVTPTVVAPNAKPVKAPVVATLAVPVIASSVTAVEDRMWQLVSLTKSMGTNSIQDGAFLSFQSSDHRIKGSTGCNRLMGSYQLTGQELSLAEIASTKIFCPNGGIIQEAIFIEALTDTAAWKVESNHLYLLNAQQETVAVFELR